MIVETIIASSAAVIISATGFGCWLTVRLNPKLEERRILERARKTWFEANALTPAGSGFKNDKIMEIDQQLIELARRKDEDDI